MSEVGNSASLQRRIARVLTSYQVGEIVDIKPASHGIENDNFFIKTRDDERIRHFVITFVRQPSNSGHLYTPMLETLFRDGLPVAPPLPANAPIEEPVLLQRRLPGRHTINPTLRQIQGIGRFTARMHRSMARRNLDLPAHPRTHAWLIATTSSWSTALPYLEWRLLEDSIDRIKALLARHDVQDLPRGMIHGDIFRDNVLFNEHALTGVLDFHHASTGFWLFDLAVIANDWCTDTNGRLDPDRAHTLLKSYHQIRGLTEQELWFFSTFTLYAGVCFWVSRIAANRVEQKHQPVRTKNPDEFLDIVTQATRHPLYLDPRILNTS